MPDVQVPSCTLTVLIMFEYLRCFGSMASVIIADFTTSTAGRHRWRRSGMLPPSRMHSSPCIAVVSACSRPTPADHPGKSPASRAVPLCLLQRAQVVLANPSDRSRMLQRHAASSLRMSQGTLFHVMGAREGGQGVEGCQQAPPNINFRGVQSAPVARAQVDTTGKCSLAPAGVLTGIGRRVAQQCGPQPLERSTQAVCAQRSTHAFQHGGEGCCNVRACVWWGAHVVMW